MARTLRIAITAIIATMGSALADDPPTSLQGEALVATLLEFVEEGSPGAQFLLGSLYDTGQQGVPEDDTEAVRWYRLAAEQGLAEAQVNLGVMYDNGEGVPEDDTEAARWYRLAAEQGHAKAQLNVALQYITGEGVPADHVQAYAWLNMAVAGGDPHAENVRVSLAEAMTPEQIVGGAGTCWRTEGTCPAAVARCCPELQRAPRLALGAPQGLPLLDGATDGPCFVRVWCW